MEGIYFLLLKQESGGKYSIYGTMYFLQFVLRASFWTEMLQDFQEYSNKLKFSSSREGTITSFTFSKHSFKFFPRYSASIVFKESHSDRNSLPLSTRWVTILKEQKKNGKLLLPCNVFRLIIYVALKYPSLFSRLLFFGIFHSPVFYLRPNMKTHSQEPVKKNSPSCMRN